MKTLFAALLTRPWIVSTVAMWTVSFSLALPGLLYAIALGIAVATLPSLWSAGGTRRTAAQGLLLIALAGLKLDFSYFALLSLAGTALLCLPSAEPALHRPPSPAAGQSAAASTVTAAQP